MRGSSPCRDGAARAPSPLADPPAVDRSPSKSQRPMSMCLPSGRSVETLNAGICHIGGSVTFRQCHKGDCSTRPVAVLLELALREYTP